MGVGLCEAHGPLGIIISTHNRWGHCAARPVPVTLRDSHTHGGPNNLQSYWAGLRIE